MIILYSYVFWHQESIKTNFGAFGALLMVFWAPPIFSDTNYWSENEKICENHKYVMIIRYIRVF